MSLKKADKIYFPNLDGFRTISFLAVFLGHCFILFDFGERTFVIKCLNKVLGKPGIGVHFFFVLSGFLISYLLLSENENFKKINIPAFYMRRILRIWPVYFFVILIALGLSIIHKPYYSLHDANFFLIATFLTNFNLAIIGISSLPITVLWSVAVEEQFYLALPLIMYFFSKKVFYFFPILIAFAIIFGLYHTQNITYVEFHTISVSGSLLVGCIIAYLVLYKNISILFLNINKSFILAVYAGFLLLHLFREKVFAPESSNILLYFIDSLFFAFFILEQNYAKNSFYKMSNFKLLSALGKYTYGMYAYHMIFISILMTLVPYKINPANNYISYFFLWVVAFTTTLLFAKISYSFIEKPFLKLKEKF